MPDAEITRKKCSFCHEELLATIDFFRQVRPGVLRANCRACDRKRERGKTAMVRSLLIEQSKNPQPEHYQEMAERYSLSSLTQTKTGYTYFVQCGVGGPIKIGFSLKPKSRVANLQTSHYEILTLLKVVPGLDEKIVHYRFHSDCIRGEWFRPTPELMKFIESQIGDDSDLEQQHQITSEPEVCHQTRIHQTDQSVDHLAWM